MAKVESIVKNMLCSLCGTETALFKKIKTKSYYSCNTCKSIQLDRISFLDSVKEKERYDKHNDDFEDQGYQKFVSPIVNAVTEEFRTSDSGLDYGCGKSSIVQKMLFSKGFETKGYDPFYFIEDTLLKEKYNYITCCEVVEHFYDPKLEFTKLSELLLPKGKLLLKTNLYTPSINFDNWWYKNDPTHVFFYSESSFKYIQNNFNFSSVKFKNKYIELTK